MTKYYDTVAETGYDGLVADATPSLEAFGVTIRKGAGELKRGTALAFSSKDELFVPLGTAAAPAGEENDPPAEVLTPSAVLADDVSVDAESDTTAIAYRAGHFVRGKLIFATGYTLSKTDEEELRKAGILLSDAIA
jgi:hypothetical protein